MSSVSYAKVEHNDEYGDWSVNYLYLGHPANEQGVPLRRLGPDNYVPMTDVAARWVTMSLTPNSAATAHTIAARASAICAMVVRHAADLRAGAAPTASMQRAIWGRSASDPGLLPSARLGIRRVDGGYQVSEYDFRSWTELLPD